jgi:uncharacterized DUF497 family protein
VKITFDPAKNALNQEKHGVPLVLAESFEWDTSIVNEDDRMRYNEQRFVATGFIGNSVFVFVFCYLGDETVRAISLRRAEPKEARKYANHQN